jgi:hypothetical protein
MSKPRYYEIVEAITTPEDVISKNIKTQTLNTLSLDLTSIKNGLTDKLILNKIGYLNSTIEDAYKVDMYKFQFKVFIDILTKEIQDLKNAIILL